MLLRFGVANHLSIRDFQELSFSASSLRDRRDGLIACETAPGGSVVPAAVVYGANASGKSNLVRAVRTMRRMVLFSQTKGEPGGGVSRQPFLLDAALSGEPSRFELDLFVGGVRHHHGFEASDAVFDRMAVRLSEVTPANVVRARRERISFRARVEEAKQRHRRLDPAQQPVLVDGCSKRTRADFGSVRAHSRNRRRPRRRRVRRGVCSISRGDLDRRIIDFLGKIGTGVVSYRRNETEFSENS